MVVTEQEQIKRLVEFAQWVVPNAEKLGIQNTKSIKKFAAAQKPEDLLEGFQIMVQELGEENFATLLEAFKKSKSQPMFKHGGKLDYLINKFR